MSRLALFVLLVGCTTSSPAPRTLANVKQPPALAVRTLEPINASGDFTKQIQVGGYGLVTIGLAGTDLVRVEGETLTSFATLPAGFDYMIDPLVPEDAPGDFYVVGSRSSTDGRAITTATWTFWWDRASERFVSRAPAITQRPNSCEVCLQHDA